MTRLSAKQKYYVVFIAAQICGRGFEDMCRYDNCCPASEHESAKLEHALHSGATWVIFKRFVPIGGTAAPTVERWKSFGIVCLPEAFEEYYDAERALQERGLRSDR